MDIPVFNSCLSSFASPYKFWDCNMDCEACAQSFGRDKKSCIHCDRDVVINAGTDINSYLKLWGIFIPFPPLTGCFANLFRDFYPGRSARAASPPHINFWNRYKFLFKVMGYIYPGLASGRLRLSSRCLA